jgi:hypothetical protein
MKSERECERGLPQWTDDAVTSLSNNLAYIIILLSLLAQKANLILDQIIFEKIKKNEEKYPVELVRGSSEKYTHYRQQLKDSKRLSNNVNYLVAASVSIIVSFVAGLCAQAALIKHLRW